ncbi:NifU family protein [Xanthobacter sediminis]
MSALLSTRTTDDEGGEQDLPTATDRESEAERHRIIADTIETLRTRMQADGGDIALVSIEGSRVRVHLAGACAACGLSNATLGFVRKRLSEALGGGPVLVVPALKDSSGA